MFKYSNNKFYHNISARQIRTLCPALEAVELAKRLLLFNIKMLLKIKTSKRIPVFKQGREQKPVDMPPVIFPPISLPAGHTRRESKRQRLCAPRSATTWVPKSLVPFAA